MNEFYITVYSHSKTLPLLKTLGNACVWTMVRDDGEFITTYQVTTDADEDTVREFMHKNNLDYLCVEL